MPIIALLLAASLQAHAAPRATPLCRAAQLHMTVNDDGFGGMSHSGAELSLRNTGGACRLPTMPLVTMSNARGRLIGHGVGDASTRTLPLGAGRSATIMVRWVSSDVVDNSRHVRARRVSVRIGGGSLTGPIDATMYTAAGERFDFEQQPAQLAEGLPAG